MLRGCKCSFTHGNAFLCPCASFGLLLPERVWVDSDGIPTRRLRSSSLLSFYFAAAHSGFVGPPGADRLCSSLTKGPQYSLLTSGCDRSHRVDAHSLSVGSKLEFLWCEHMGVLPHRSTQKIHWVYDGSLSSNSTTSQ
jgi:hypothetical protein